MLGEYVLLETVCFYGIRAKQVNIPDTTKWSPCRREDYASDSYIEFFPVSAESMDDIIGDIFMHSIWHYMEILKSIRRKGDWGVVEALAEAYDPLSPADQDKYPFSPDEILNLMDENEKHLIRQFEDNYTRTLNTPVSDEDLPFQKIVPKFGLKNDSEREEKGITQKAQPLWLRFCFVMFQLGITHC